MAAFEVAIRSEHAIDRRRWCWKSNGGALKE
jgi:hypothetical protein